VNEASHPFAGVVDEVAPRLLGMVLISAFGGVECSVALTEVEAYGQADPASHSFRGPSVRNRTMFGPPGHLYVYRSYGIHWCANVVTGPAGEGAAVLLRCGVPVAGMSTMALRRGRSDHLADGPGKLCQALAIDGSHDGLDLLDPESPIRLAPGGPVRSWTATHRIGITRGTDRPWRFVADGSSYLPG
jgi:DNA-3-methyladenine glycosylase